MKTNLIYKNKPLFGLDIGQSTVKVIRLKRSRGKTKVVGYGYGDFDPAAFKDGEIVKPKLIKKTLQPLIEHVVIGTLDAERIAASIPSSLTYTRMIDVPVMDRADLDNAVRLEAEQYIPLPASDIYLEYEILGTVTTGKGDENYRVLLVAAPKRIIDSYLTLFDMLKLDVFALEPSLVSIMRAVNHAMHDDTPRILIDFGSTSSDFAIYDDGVQLTSTVEAGGEQITGIIARELNISPEKAAEVKSRYGIGKSKWQGQLAVALQPILTQLASEIQKLLRYHHERNQQEKPIDHIAIVGGGANLPGLAEFISHLTGVKVAICNPWDGLEVKPLQPPHRLETTLYSTAIGLALIEVERNS